MALETLLSARAVLEAQIGTPLTPTRLIYFDDGSHDQKITTITPTEKRASYFPTFRAYPGIERDGLSFAGDWTFDQAIFWLNLHTKAVASGVGGTADKTWAFVPSASTDDLKSATFQFGYSDGIGATKPAWSLPGCLGDELKLTWRKGDTVKFASKLMSAYGASQISAFTGSLSDVVTTSALGTATQVWIDTTTIGSTLDPNIMDVDFTINNGYSYLDTLNNTATAAQILRGKPRTFKLDFTRYYANDTELDLNVTKTPRKIRVRTVGPVLGGSFYSITLDAYGVYDGDSYEKSVVDGMGVEKYSLIPIWDTGATTDYSITIVNATAAIT